MLATDVSAWYRIERDPSPEVGDTKTVPIAAFSQHYELRLMLLRVARPAATSGGLVLPRQKMSLSSMIQRSKNLYFS